VVDRKPVEIMQTCNNTYVYSPTNKAKEQSYTANISITANGDIVSTIPLFNMNSSFGLEKHNTLM